MTDALFSLSFSLNWRKEKSIFGTREKFAANEEERERLLDYFTRTHLETGWEKKGRRKKTRSFLSLSLCSSLSFKGGEKE
jgi:hypothetical protein